ncbi:MarR family winged helix-turn-helix transcriptional regulator [Streptomyces sp. NPDC056373]|uniref:MarR family winged helix-turn-helix transcriptional regulator n=1 Tax=Streptomyces sp. NPDC056373 TaxID=3345798 RepID=UPI0035D55A9E
MERVSAAADILAYETLTLISRLAETSVNRVLQQEFALAREEYATLSHLHRSPHQFLHMTELATALGFSRSRVSRAVARQELRGLISRTACPRDARAAHAAVTDQGIVLLQQVSGLYEATVRGSLTQLGIDTEQMTGLVEHLTANGSAHPITTDRAFLTLTRVASGCHFVGHTRTSGGRGR